MEQKSSLGQQKKKFKRKLKVTLKSKKSKKNIIKRSNDSEKLNPVCLCSPNFKTREDKDKQLSDLNLDILDVDKGRGPVQKRADLVQTNCPTYDSLLHQRPTNQTLDCHKQANYVIDRLGNDISSTPTRRSTQTKNINSVVNNTKSRQLKREKMNALVVRPNKAVSTRITNPLLPSESHRQSLPPPTIQRPNRGELYFKCFDQLVQAYDKLPGEFGDDSSSHDETTNYGNVALARVRRFGYESGSSKIGARPLANQTVCRDRFMDKVLAPQQRDLGDRYIPPLSSPHTVTPTVRDKDESLHIVQGKVSEQQPVTAANNSRRAGTLRDYSSTCISAFRERTKVPEISPLKTKHMDSRIYHKDDVNAEEFKEGRNLMGSSGEGKGQSDDFEEYKVDFNMIGSKNSKIWQKRQQRAAEQKLKCNMPRFQASTWPVRIGLPSHVDVSLPVPKPTQDKQVDDIVFPPFSLLPGCKKRQQTHRGNDIRNSKSSSELTSSLQPGGLVDTIMAEADHGIRLGRASRKKSKKRRLVTKTLRVNLGLGQGPRVDSVVRHVQQECQVKGYEILRRLQRVDFREHCHVSLANNRNNPRFSPVEITVYRKPCAEFTSSLMTMEGGRDDKRYSHRQVVIIPPHANLVMLLHRFQTDLWCYQVTEHCPWPTLSQLISSARGSGVRPRKGLREEQCKIIFRQVTLGLCHLHSHGVLHGDINCTNVLVTDDLQVKLTAYGPCCQRMMAASRCIRNHCNMKGEHFDAYTPPELLNKREVWKRTSDIWCLGVTLLNMLLGHVPPEVTAVIRLNFSAKNVSKYNLASLGYQVTLLLDNILHVRPNSRPNVWQVLNHAWLADGSRYVNRIQPREAKVHVKRTDGKSFPLPKRVSKSSADPADFYMMETDTTSHSTSPEVPGAATTPPQRETAERGKDEDMPSQTKTADVINNIVHNKTPRDQLAGFKDISVTMKYKNVSEDDENYGACQKSKRSDCDPEKSNSAECKTCPLLAISNGSDQIEQCSISNESFVSSDSFNFWKNAWTPRDEVCVDTDEMTCLDQNSGSHSSLCSAEFEDDEKTGDRVDGGRQANLAYHAGQDNPACCTEKAQEVNVRENVDLSFEGAKRWERCELLRWAPDNHIGDGCREGGCCEWENKGIGSISSNDSSSDNFRPQRHDSNNACAAMPLCFENEINDETGGRFRDKYLSGGDALPDKDVNRSDLIGKVRDGSFENDLHVDLGVETRRGIENGSGTLLNRSEQSEMMPGEVGVVRLMKKPPPFPGPQALRKCWSLTKKEPGRLCRAVLNSNKRL
ncbi:uncharacterized protein LOC101846591 [Aplysia californica]|uniref:Uncharacterized protein LOC101846591 n=1 Tax=Aplysia californica TaxID=6500 RepID=A0ABM1A333_APLCA|nr:uncharacterized protein LOC101846591 [Aplysia californica]